MKIFEVWTTSIAEIDKRTDKFEGFFGGELLEYLGKIFRIFQKFFGFNHYQLDLA